MQLVMVVNHGKYSGSRGCNVVAGVVSVGRRYKREKTMEVPRKHELPREAEKSDDNLFNFVLSIFKFQT